MPDVETMQKYLSEGLTQKQIAERWEAESGQKIGRSAIAMAMRRYGLESNRPTPRYENVIPWTLAPEHRMSLDARILRLEARRREGKSLTDSEKRQLQGWRDRLTATSTVVTYTQAEGFMWVPRRADDFDIIRWPRGMPRPDVEHPPD